MSSEHDHNHTLPWMFRRDEIDVLEEDFNELLRGHDARARTRAYAYEADVLDEQVKTEAATEAELAKRMGPEWIAASAAAPAAGSGAACAHEDLEPGNALRDALVRDATRDPFYERTYAWAEAVFRWAGARYEDERARSRDLFRVYVNAYLVPAKIAFGQNEEAHEDAEAYEVAAREYELAATYLNRTRESLQALCATGEAGADGEAMSREADAIAHTLDHMRKRLDSLRSQHPPLGTV